MNASLLRLRRAEIEARLEELIDMLNLLDGDPDLEDSGDDEPWLAGEPSRGCFDLEVDGDEQDYNGDEADQSVGRLTGGCGL